jgi:8-hydroxy-5-deazaflavin:NADPH oxidoreductase
MRIGILGSGEVAKVLGAGFLRHGHDVMMGTRDPARLSGWLDEHPGAQAGDPATAADHGEVVVLAVKGAVAAEVLAAAGEEHLAGKPVIDTTNPLADEPPENGVVRYFTDLDTSLMEQLQQTVPTAHLVKAFKSVGNAVMVDPALPGGPPTMFICGDDAGAKELVSGLLESFGWEVADLGAVEAARAIEPLCMLWCIPGFVEGSWNHAFKLLRPNPDAAGRSAPSDEGVA